MLRCRQRLWSCSSLSGCRYGFSPPHTCNVGWEGVINEYCSWSCSSLSGCRYSFFALHTCNVGWEGCYQQILLVILLQSLRVFVQLFCPAHLQCRMGRCYQQILLVIPLQCGLWTHTACDPAPVWVMNTLLVILLQCGLWTHTACDPAPVWVMNTHCLWSCFSVGYAHSLWSHSSVGYEHTLLVIPLQCGLWTHSASDPASVWVYVRHFPLHTWCWQKSLMFQLHDVWLKVQLHSSTHLQSRLGRC